ncbi:hypothetical protein ACFRH4_08740 [Streptomyces mirabilis]|uniref:hypothetical protein n=1 Tax=Streptomyces mirabilis TaxID=68239 RepID=UPI0036C0AAEC
MSNAQAIVLTRPEATRDRQNSATYDWSTAQRKTYGVMLQPLNSMESVKQSDQVITTRQVFFPPDAAVTEYDRVEIGNTTYEVDGQSEPQQGAGPLAALSYLAVVLKKVTG